MPRRRHGFAAAVKRAMKNDDDFDVVFDLRNIPEQIEKEAEYIERNLNRSANTNVEGLYVDSGKGTRIGRWGGDGNSGKSVEAGLFSTTAEAGVYEQELNLGGVNVGVVNENSQIGIEAGASALTIAQRIGPAKVECDALSAGYEIGLGKNTGGFVRGTLASAGLSCGPVGANIAIGFDTGARAGADGLEVRALGTGFMVDKNEGIEFSLFGSSIKFKPW